MKLKLKRFISEAEWENKDKLKQAIEFAEKIGKDNLVTIDEELYACGYSITVWY